jgi:hypothetical protein
MKRKHSDLKSEHPTLQNMKFLDLFSISVGHLCPPGSGSTDLIEPGSNSDPDPQHCNEVDAGRYWKVAVLMGADKETAAAQLWKVIEFEVRIAKISIDEADRHDTGQWYRKGGAIANHNSRLIFFITSSVFSLLNAGKGFCRTPYRIVQFLSSVCAVCTPWNAS